MAQRPITLFVKVFTSCLLTLICACVTSPSDSFSNKSRAYGFDERVISTSEFDLTIYTNSAYRDALKDGRLNIYIGGDGQPFFRNRYVNSDPTSRRALTLELMSLDTGPSIYLGRPCYHKATARNCKDNKWWTSHRYSKEVVAAMNGAINELSSSAKKLTLIGFSGGGTIATLLTMTRKDVQQLVAINPNLNIHAWAQQHSYSPLYGSLNPYDLAHQLPIKTDKLFLVGGHDNNVSSDLWIDRFSGQKNAEVLVFPSFDHNCCWVDNWKETVLSFAN